MVNNRLRPSAAPVHTRAMPRFLVALHCLLFLGAAQAQTEVDAQVQRDLIDAQVARFPDEPSTGARVYFLGFAGNGKERVFAEEIKLAAQRVGDKFGSTHRTVLLLNDRRDFTTWPLASTSSLKYAIDALAGVMNLEEDVLFIALSSHGWKNATIEVANEGMTSQSLRARTVARFLEEAGIRWKVVVVSACYSGTFVEPLADNHSIVITAASRSRTSFGCSDTRDLTYFGESFYRDALPVSAHLRDAFEKARLDVRRKEQEQKFTPSQPQGYFGLLLEEKMHALGRAPAP